MRDAWRQAQDTPALGMQPSHMKMQRDTCREWMRPSTGKRTNPLKLVVCTGIFLHARARVEEREGAGVCVRAKERNTGVRVCVCGGGGGTSMEAN
jgi:hypothetical protein